MISDFIQSVLEELLRPVFEFGLRLLGRAVIAVVSLGQWKCDRFKRGLSQCTLRLGGLYYLRDNQVHITVGGTEFVGLISILLPLVSFLVTWFLERK